MMLLSSSEFMTTDENLFQDLNDAMKCCYYGETQ